MIWFLKSVVAMVTINGILADKCSELCRLVPGCARGSWCKGDPDRGSCHNLFYDSTDKSGGIHYHTQGMISEYPVLCGEAQALIGRVASREPSVPVRTTQTPRAQLDVVNMDVISVSLSESSSTPVPVSTPSTQPTPARVNCAEICESVDACRAAGKGSYCKPNGTCTGLFFRSKERSTICYHSAGSDCPEDFPVVCDARSGRVEGPSPSYLSSRAPSAVTTTATPAALRTVPRHVARIDRTSVDSIMTQINHRRFRSATGEFGVIVGFEEPHLRLEFTYRGARTIVDELEYVIESNFVRLRDGSSLRILINTVESMGSAITHHHHSAHLVTIHIVPAGAVQNDETYVIVRLGDLPPVTCTEL